jgi:hypothetical protein
MMFPFYGWLGFYFVAPQRCSGERGRAKWFPLLIGVAVTLPEDDSVNQQRIIFLRPAGVP